MLMSYLFIQLTNLANGRVYNFCPILEVCDCDIHALGIDARFSSLCAGAVCLRVVALRILQNGCGGVGVLYPDPMGKLVPVRLDGLKGDAELCKIDRGGHSLDKEQIFYHRQTIDDTRLPYGEPPLLCSDAEQSVGRAAESQFEVGPAAYDATDVGVVSCGKLGANYESAHCHE